MSKMDPSTGGRMTTKPKTREAPARCRKSNVVAFPDFAGMDIKIDVAEERWKWDTLFASAQIALRFCQFDHVRAAQAAREMIEDESDGDIIGDMLARLSDSIDYLRDITKIMEAAGTRLAVSADRSLGKTIPKPKPPAVAKALARCKAAQAAYDAAEAAGDDATLEHQGLVEDEIFDKLAKTPCTSDAEFIEKFRYMIAHETKLCGSPLDSRAEFRHIAVAVAAHLGGAREAGGGEGGKESSAAAKNEHGRVARTIIDGIVGMMKEYAASVALAMGGA